MRRLSRRSVAFGLAAAALAAGALLPGAASAQGTSRQSATAIPGAPLGLDAKGDPIPFSNARAAKRTFDLFGNADIAVSRIKSPGVLRFCTVSRPFDSSCGTGIDPRAGQLQFSASHFRNIDFIYGAPPSQRSKIIDLPNGRGAGLRDALGGGWTVRGSSAAFVTNGGDNLLPVDNQLGTLWSGAQIRADGSCLDHTYSWGAGNALMPGSDCPATWGSLGWQGRRPIPLETYRDGLATRGFDFWKYTDGEPDPSGKLDRAFGSFQTYALFSDWTKDELCGSASTRTYGKVIVPARSDCPNVDPTKPGYPLGLTMRYDAFNYGIPALQDIAFYQVTIRNDSKLLYGAPVDYDSLYIGLLTGYFGNNQEGTVYYKPEISGVVHTQHCAIRTPNCNGAAVRADQNPATPGITAQPAFAWGSTALIVLKSPIGDLRNKLLTRPGSAFQGLGDPDDYDDTITFNHAHMCGFRACSNQTFGTADNLPDHMRRQFGMISSTDVNSLGTRQPSDLTPQQLWHQFRSVDFPAQPPIGDAANQFPQTGGFNRWVPGTTAQTGQWDWNDDGQADTLYYDSCSGKTGAIVAGRKTTDSYCSAAFQDTLPRKAMTTYANVGSPLTVGPISLAADSTTSFVFAVTAACCGRANSDSAALFTKINAAIDHYLNFYLGPEPLVRDTIVAVDVVGGPPAVNEVRLTFTQSNERFNDPFLLNLAASTAAAARTTPTGRLVALNPWLADSIKAYATQLGQTFPSATGSGTITAVGNLRRVYIFKSCDRGTTYTNDAACTPAPATGGPFATLGWLPYATLNPTAGDIVNQFTDQNVNGGTSYTYVIVGESKGAAFSVNTADAIDSVLVGTTYRYFCTAGCATQRIEFAPALFNTLGTSGPNVANVYVPVSAQAGGGPATVTVRTLAGPAAGERVIVTRAATAPVPGEYLVTFYDSVRVTQVDTLDNNLQNTLAAYTIVARFRGTTADTVRATAIGGVGLQGATVVGTPTVVATTRDGVPVRVRTTTYRLVPATAGSVVAVVTRGNTPIQVSNTVSGNATSESFYSSSLFPGFNLAFAAVADLAVVTPRGRFTTGELFQNPAGDTLTQLSTPYVRTTASTAVAANFQGGDITFTWEANVWGPGSPFRLNFANPTETQTAVTTSLNARAVAQVGVTDTQAARLIGLTGQDSLLVPVKLPFEVRNEAFGRNVEVVMRRRGSRTATEGDLLPPNTIRLGSGADTMSVTVPTDVWIPGDTLHLLETVNGTRRRIFSAYVLSCSSALGFRVSCNPLALNTPGATGFLDTPIGTRQGLLFAPKITTDQQFSFTILPPAAGSGLLSACSSGGDAEACAAIRNDIKNVKVVPNPYLVTSNYIDPTAPNSLTKPILFTHVPPRGVVKIWTVSGQLVQQISWDETQLNGTGDLLWDLRTREGNLIAGGLYLFTITGRDENGGSLGSHMGKFVVIR